MKNKKTRLFLLSLFAASALFFLLESGILPGIDRTPEATKSFRILGTAISLIRDDYVEKPDPAQTMEGAYKGLINSLDRMSGYLNKHETANFLAGRKKPIPETGIILYKDYGTFPVITGIRKNSPAEEKELKTGDSIGAINGVSTLYMSLLEADMKLRTIQPGSIRLKIIRAHENQEITLKTRLIPDPSFSLETEPGTSGILKIRNFSPDGLNEFRKKWIPLLRDSQKPLILDLRNCNQGDYDESCKFLDFFVRNEKIGTWTNEIQGDQNIGCPGDAVLSHLPLFIWTNQATAGPSEMAVRVLRDNADEAVVIGLHTPGLVSRGEFYLFEDQSGMILTSSVFSPASPSPLWKEGVKPDIQIDSSDLSREAYLKATRKAASD